MKFPAPFLAAWLCCLAAFFCLLPALRAESTTGNIQVICEPGVLVFLNGELKGETNADVGGLIIRNVPAGRHEIKVVKEGFSPQVTTVELRGGQNISHRIDPFAPEIKVEQRGQKSAARVARKTGHLIIQSLPINCTISIRGIVLTKDQQVKDDDEWSIEKAPQGDFPAEFTDGHGHTLRHTIKVREDQLTHLFVDFLAGKVEVRAAPPDDTVAQRAAALSETKSDSVPVVVQARPAPPAELTRPPEEIIAEQQAIIAGHSLTISRVNEVLAAGGMSIADIQSATVQRQWHEQRMDLAKAIIVEQQLRLVEIARRAATARRDAFAADMVTLLKLLEDATLPPAAKNAAWTETVNKWSVQNAPPGPTRGRFEWNKDALSFVAMGRLEIRTEPVAGAELELTGPDGGKSCGRSPLRLDDVPEGTYAVVAQRRGYLPATGNVTVSRDRLGLLTMQLINANRSIPDLGLQLIRIEPGTFTMGSGNGNNGEAPVTQVTINRPYWLGQTEVTQAQWSAVMGGNPSTFRGESLPVEQVSWNGAMEFCRKLTEWERAAGRLPEGYAYTLPTEAQWEFACRAGTTGDYAGELDSMAWYSANSGSATHPVGQKQANAWSLSDMHGNVWEWCLDWYGNYPGGSVTDPAGPSSGSFRVLRGGSWGNDASYCRSAYRYRNEPGSLNSLGFRLALSSVR